MELNELIIKDEDERLSYEEVIEKVEENEKIHYEERLEYDSGRDTTNKKRYVSFQGKTIKNITLFNRDLEDADFSNAYLSNVDFSFSNLRNARFDGAVLEDVSFGGANLRNATFTNTKFESNVKFQGSWLPLRVCFNESEQSRYGFIVNKRVIGYKMGLNHELITLSIPKGAIIFSVNKEKCRTNKAMVLSIEENHGTRNARFVKSALSNFDGKFVYRVGKFSEVKDFDLDYTRECSSGIHFFRTKKEALEYSKTF